MKSSPARALGVTAALLVFGALFGALAAVLAAFVAFSITLGPSEAIFVDALAIAGIVGAGLGGVLLPAACWLLLRRVPLGLAFLGTVLGTVVGGVLGWVLGHNVDMILGPIAGALVGFLFATIFLRVRFSAPIPGDRIARTAGT